jgi:pimeloyl-ACP methyl ester carboxylesterase
MRPLLKLFPTLAVLAVVGCDQAAGTTFDVKVTGKGKPILLIPGLTCGSNVWDGTVARLKDRYECHVLTLPGFAGQPAVEGPFLEPVRDDIIAYVKAKGLRRPAIVGHSLGAFLGFSLESTAPDLFGPLVAVDGGPWQMAVFDPRSTVDSIRPQVEAMKKGMAAGNATPGGFEKGTRSFLVTQVKDPKHVDFILSQSAKSDPETVTNAMVELMLTDLRPAAAKITSPVLLFAAGDWADTDQKKQMLRRGYEMQVANVKNAKVIPVWGARHFVMFDQPDLFHKELERFLGESWAKH